MNRHSREYNRNRELMSTHLRRRHTPDLSPTTAQLPLGVSLRPKCIELQKHRDLALHVPSGKTIRAAEYEWACGRLFSHYNYGFRTGGSRETFHSDCSGRSCFNRSRSSGPALHGLGSRRKRVCGAGLVERADRGHLRGAGIPGLARSTSLKGQRP